MGEWPEETRAALCQEYAPRDPFAEFARGDITINTLRLLVQHLYAWTQEREFAAQIIDQLQFQRWAYASVNREKNAPAPAVPDLVPRPWQAEELERQRAENAAGEVAARDWFVENVEAQLITAKGGG